MEKESRLEQIVQCMEIDELPPEQRELAEVVGLAAYRRLVAIYGGMAIYIQKPDKLLRTARNEQIIKKFNGYNHRELAREYGLSEQSIRLIVLEMEREIKQRPMEGQVTLFGE